MPPTDEIDKRPVDRGGNINQPSSGTYGERANLDRLKSSLPEMKPAAPAAGGQPSPGPAPAGPPINPVPTTGQPTATPPPGVPSVLMAPTDRPDVPVSSPLAAGAAPIAPGAPQIDGTQRRLQILDMLAYSPQVSPETREWAKGVIKAISA